MAFDSQACEISAFDDNLSRRKQAVEGINDIGTAQTASPFQRPDQLGQTLSARPGQASIVRPAKTAAACIFCWLDARRLHDEESGLMSEGRALWEQMPGSATFWFTVDEQTSRCARFLRQT
jgi:hypothetical protein